MPRSCRQLRFFRLDIPLTKAIFNLTREKTKENFNRKEVCRYHINVFIRLSINLEANLITLTQSSRVFALSSGGFRCSLPADLVPPSHLFLQTRAQSLKRMAV